MLNGKKVVGIVPYSLDYGKSEDRYADKYLFTDTYGVRAMEAGMIPVGVLPVDCRIRTEILDLCDVFIVEGGRAMNPFHVEVMDYAVKSGKKLLGICLGLQSIQVYCGVKAEAEKRGWTGNLGDLYLRLRAEKKNNFLAHVEGHYPSPILPRENVDCLKHPVKLTEGSHIARILGTTEVNGASLHHLCIGTPAPGITVTGYAPDGTIEAVECGENIIGTQFHPDVDNELHQLFDWLAE